MQNDKLKGRLSLLLSKYEDSGLYSHAFAATGNLDSADPIASVELGGSNIIFDLSSLTKALCTSPLIFRELMSRSLSEKSSLKNWLTHAKVLKDLSLIDSILDLSFESILSHTSGLPFWRNFYVCRLNQEPAQNFLSEPARTQHLLDSLSRISPDKSQANKDLYSDVGMIALGMLLELVHQKRLDEVFEEFKSQSLKLSSANTLQFATKLSGHRKEMFAPTGHCFIRERDLIGEVHDENCASFGGVSGHSGLFATGKSLIDYLKALFSSKIGIFYLKKNAEKISSGNSSLLGMRQGNDDSANSFADGLSIGHLGFTGTAFWLCPISRRYAVLLTNRVKTKRISPEIKVCRREVFALLDEISR